MTTVGVLALQGAFIEHEQKLQQLGAENRSSSFATPLDRDRRAHYSGWGKTPPSVMLATSYELIEPLKHFAQTKPTWGTCAGMIFLASRFKQHHQPYLGVMDVTG
jgi:5'-phosphate synthase pdxT subunit